MIQTIALLEESIQRLHQQAVYFNNAYQVCLSKGTESQVIFYKKWLVKLLQKQCDLSAELYILRLKAEPTTKEALDLFGVDYTAFDGLIFIHS